MPFPEIAERVIYGKIPLIRVISQIRFLPILSIEADIPARFQEKIVERFPRYNEKREMSTSLPLDMQNLLPQQMIIESPKNHIFKSEDRNWQINLTKTFISVSTTNYVSWDVFRENFSMAFEACKEIYSPRKITRAGLRYINEINRNTLGIKDISWNDLIRPSVLGLNSEDGIGENILSSTTSYEIKLANLEHYMAKINTQWEDEQRNDSLILDMDISSERKVEVHDVDNILSNFNSVAGRIFRWCITEELHKNMEPKLCQ